MYCHRASFCSRLICVLSVFLSRELAISGGPPRFSICNTPRHSAPHCNTMQHTAAHCNTLATQCAMWNDYPADFCSWWRGHVTHMHESVCCNVWQCVAAVCEMTTQLTFEKFSQTNCALGGAQVEILKSLLATQFARQNNDSTDFWECFITSGPNQAVP